MINNLLRLLSLLTVSAALSVWGALPDKVLTVGNGAEPVSIDPHLFRGTAEAQILKDMFEGLVVLEDAEIRPANASHWQISNDGLTYVFYLRPDLKWSDGSRLTATDYVYSFRRAINPDTGTNYAWYFRTATIGNAADILEGNQPVENLAVKAINDYQLEIRLEKPITYFLELLDFPVFLPVPESAIEQYGQNWVKANHFKSNGAYKLKEWLINDKLELIRNTHYYRNQATHIDRVIYLPTGDQNAELNRYLTGGIDITLGIPISHYEKLAKERPEELIDTPRLSLNMLMFNCTNSPTSHASLRKALSYSIDRSKLVLLDPSKNTVPLYLMMPPISKGALRELPDYASWTQIERENEARRLYGQAGYNKDNPLQLRLMTNNRLSNSQRATVLAQMWEKVLGVRVTIDKYEWITYVDKLFKKDFQIVMSPWLGAYDDPSAFMELMVSDFQSNAAGFNNPRYDELVKRARITKGQDRVALYQSAQNILLDQMPVAPLHTIGSLKLVKRRVLNYPTENPSGFFLTRKLDVNQ